MVRRRRVASTRTIGSTCGLKPGPRPERLDTDRISLDPFGLAAQYGFNNETEKARKLRRAAEQFALGQAIQRCANLVWAGRRLVGLLPVAHRGLLVRCAEIYLCEKSGCIRYESFSG